MTPLILMVTGGSIALLSVGFCLGMWFTREYYHVTEKGLHKALLTQLSLTQKSLRDVTCRFDQMQVDQMEQQRPQDYQDGDGESGYKDYRGDVFRPRLFNPDQKLCS